MAALSSPERKEIAEAAIEAAERFGDLPVASKEELLEMSRSELDAYFQARGVEIDWERLDEETRTQLGASNVLAMNRGEEFSPARREQLETRVRSAVISGAREVANEAMSKMWHEAFAEADDRPEDERFGMWLTVVGSGPPCEDCRSLHGTVFLMDAWEGSMPTDGHTVCGKRCRCRVVPCGNPGKRNEGLRVEEARRVLN